MGAVLFHLSYVYEVVLDRRALRTPLGRQLAAQAARELGTTVAVLERQAERIRNVELSRMGINLIVLAIGVFTILGHPSILWILYGVPVISMVSSYLNLHDRWSPRTGSG